MKYILQIIAAIILILLGEFVFSEHLSSHFIAEGIILIVMLVVVELSYDLIINRSRLILVIKCWYLAFKNENIRFSMSYLYRIKVNDRYLLVKNSNFSLYQFVGGKYKRTPGSKSILESFGAKDDLKMKTTGSMRDDFAIFVPAKNAIKFLNWFNTGRNREVSHWREFYEELIQGKASILSQKNFPYVNYVYVGTVITPLKRTPGWDCHEILQYDVLDLLPNFEQLKELENLQNNGDSEYLKWADNKLIQCLGQDDHQQIKLYDIGEHTKWALNLKWNKP